MFIRTKFFILIFLLITANIFCQDKKYSSWNEVVEDMVVVLNKANEIYASGDSLEAKKQVNVAYFQFYEKIGFERTVKAKISGNRAGVVELQFASLKKAMSNGESLKVVMAENTKLMTMLKEDAIQLDPKDWSIVYKNLQKELLRADNLYSQGHPGFAKDCIKEVLSSIYKASGFESALKTNSSPEKIKSISDQFNKVKNIFNKKLPKETVSQEINSLSNMIGREARSLIFKNNMAAFWINFLASLAIILKEGFEAILIVGAILAYLVKSGKKEKLSTVYMGSLIGVASSILMAILLMILARGQADKQELIEGLTMIFATAVLFYTSNWMVSKSDAHQWEGFIKEQVSLSDDKNSIMGLAFTAFLAVFREGAEIVLFYVALASNAKTSTDVSALWIGLALGIVLLFGVYYLIRYVSIKLPLKPFFLGTSIIMLLMCVSFVGSGISEFVEGDFVNPTIIKGPTLDILGIHPYVETLLAQALFLIPVVVGFVLQISNMKTRFNKAKANLIEDISPKKLGVAAILELFLGYFGVGDFYLGKIGFAVLKYSLTVFGIFFIYMGKGSLEAHPNFGLFFIYFGFVAFCVSVIWVIKDFILTILKKNKDGSKLPILK